MPTSATRTRAVRPAAGQSRIGRPTRAEAVSRQQELLDAAADLFLDLGYDEATMERIAGAVGMTKRTIYSRHEDKAALFRATVQRAIEAMVAQQDEAIAALDGEPLETVLAAVAHMRIRQVTSPVGVRLQRLVSAESRRFPEIFAMASAQITGPVVSYLAGVLERAMEQGIIARRDPGLAASAFLSMAVGASAREFASGQVVADREAQARIRFAIDLFLDGMRSR